MSRGKTVLAGRGLVCLHACLLPRRIVFLPRRYFVLFIAHGDDDCKCDCNCNCAPRLTTRRDRCRDSRVRSLHSVCSITSASTA